MVGHTNILLQRTLKAISIAVVFFALITHSSLPSHAASKNERAKASNPTRNTTRIDRSKKDARKTDRDAKSAGSRRTERGDSASARNRLKTRNVISRNTSRVETKKNSTSRETTRQATTAKQRRAVELQRAQARREAEANRLEAIARKRARDEQLRDQVQSMIAKDDLAGEDPEIRRAAVNALGNRAGTVVVMNPQTGRVYSIVNQEWALHEGFKPCSTIKLVTGLAGLNEKVIGTADTTNISENNQVTLTKALAFSNNGYFQQVGEQVGFDKMLSYARRLGLGEKTGINARNEFEGRIPSSKTYSAIHRISSHGDHFEVTALQLATLVSAIANGGKLLKPHIARTPQEEIKFKTKVRRQINIDSDVWQQMFPGMAGAVHYGSGRRVNDPAQTVAGKTGTCLEQGSWVGLFTSFAPLGNPRLAVVVIARGADGRSHLPAAVAGRIYRALGDRYDAPAALQVAATREPNSLDIPEDPANDDEEETALAEGPDNQIRDPKSLIRKDGAATNKVKPVRMSIPVSPESVKPPASAGDAPSVSGGQTRPRRVFGNK
jgi:penicillin-binding protein 2